MVFQVLGHSSPFQHSGAKEKEKLDRILESRVPSHADHHFVYTYSTYNTYCLHLSRGSLLVGKPLI
jgi:hypothetical protein